MVTWRRPGGVAGLGDRLYPQVFLKANVLEICSSAKEFSTAMLSPDQGPQESPDAPLCH